MPQCLKMSKNWAFTPEWLSVTQQLSVIETLARYWIFRVFTILFPVSVGSLSNHWQLWLKRHHSIMSDSCLLSLLQPRKSQLCLTFADTQAGTGCAPHGKKATALQVSMERRQGFEAKRLQNATAGTNRKLLATWKLQPQIIILKKMNVWSTFQENISALFFVNTQPINTETIFCQWSETSPPARFEG